MRQTSSTTTPNEPNLTYTNIQPRSDNLQPTDMEHCVPMYVCIYALSWPHGRSTHIVADTSQSEHVAKLQAIDEVTATSTIP